MNAYDARRGCLFQTIFLKYSATAAAITLCCDIPDLSDNDLILLNCFASSRIVTFLRIGFRFSGAGACCACGTIGSACGFGLAGRRPPVSDGERYDMSILVGPAAVGAAGCRGVAGEMSSAAVAAADGGTEAGSGAREAGCETPSRCRWIKEDRVDTEELAFLAFAVCFGASAWSSGAVQGT